MPIRETFWNVPHWAEIGQLVLGGLVLLIFATGCLIHVRRWRQGRPARRLDHLGRRLLSVLSQAVVQIRTSQDPFAGIMHLAIFWGMAALLVGTIVATVDWDITHLLFDFQFLKGNMYVVYELLLDLFGLFLMLGLAMAAYRRFVQRPAKLKEMSGRGFSWDDVYAIAILGLIAITGYLIEGLRIAVLQPEWARWSPVGNAVAQVFLAAGDPTNRDLHLALWVAHALFSFTFIASIPFTKLVHLFTSPVNIFFRNLGPAGALAPLPSNPHVGVKTWRDFTWKQLMDFDACVRCGRCLEPCATHASGLEPSPRNLMVTMSRYLRRRANGHELYGEVLEESEVWACSTCLACSQVCPVFTDPVSAIVGMRRYLVSEGRVGSELQGALENLGRYGNSFGRSARARAKWTRGVEPGIKDATKEAVEYVWYVGDYASYSDGVVDITRQTAALFQAAGLDFGILYSGEQNAGNDVRRVGEEGLFEMLRDQNADVLSSCQFKAIITSDPHTYNTLKNEYPDALLDGRPVLHTAELFDRLLQEGRLKLGRRLDYRVTYQDPCYLGRYNGIYEAPRRVIEATGCHLVEMEGNRQKALCCGAGGGRIWMEEGDIAERPSERRVRQAAGLPGVSRLVVACPKDITMYRDAIKTTGLEGRLEVRELAELLYEAL